MKMLAQNALLIYIDDIDASGSGGLIRSDALDTFASLGCNGVLISSECQTPDPSACLKALLGVSASGECAYPRMNVVFYSDHQTARKAIPERFHMINEVGDAEILECVKSSLSKGSNTLVFLHLAETHLDLLDSLVRYYVSDEVNAAQVFVSVVQNASSRMEEYVSNATISNVYRPRQSFTKVDGAYVDDNTAPQYFVLSYFQHNRIRKDDVKRYELSEFAHRNGYGSMNLRALIKEIAFRLGCTPKYGA
uniref:Uncharacterized protein AlNc14C92G5748 n=1 Tax=Albugo laibachii Nc14 TaxID=890382 RepID=F0WGM0_9STRA|nr:conserved hypothetical protein [Albugo laibachii Nc14]|eukprot:CCA20384.1 conserved hypothetical protein [Albugo laibachii Nc14]